MPVVTCKMDTFKIVTTWSGGEAYVGERKAGGGYWVTAAQVDSIAKGPWTGLHWMQSRCTFTEYECRSWSSEKSHRYRGKAKARFLRGWCKRQKRPARADESRTIQTTSTMPVEGMLVLASFGRPQHTCGTPPTLRVSSTQAYNAPTRRSGWWARGDKRSVRSEAGCVLEASGPPLCSSALLSDLVVSSPPPLVERALLAREAEQPRKMASGRGIWTGQIGERAGEVQSGNSIDGI
ncbi:hypothetical protein C8R44DRAFT_727991 [Mycena epipterygia]|nr:hypothetical protein C8R44DRAFT_727991 [Mycena epipterygia]